MTDENSILAKRHKDCFACRIVSGTGLIAMGAYVWYHSKTRSKAGKVIMIGVSTGKYSARKRYNCK